MAVAIPDKERTRLVRLLGMLGSDYDGERANAGRMADTLVRSLGLRWGDVVAGAREQQRSADRHRIPDHRAVAAACLDSDCPWTEWEEGFLTSIQRRPWRPTEKQAAVLRRLCRRAGIDDDF